ncbi:MAG: PepSY domain-containing protein [Anaerolineae bacterium]
MTQTTYESLVNLLQLLPEPAVLEVADFADYLFRKHVQLAVDERAARRKANGWLVTWVGNMLMAEHAQLRYTNGRPVWRFEVFVTSLSRSPRGPIGYVDVDALTGEVLNSEKDIEAMQRAGEALESSLSPSA